MSVLESALALDPRDPIITYNLSIARFRLGKIELASRLCEKALELYPQADRAAKWCRARQRPGIPIV